MRSRVLEVELSLAEDVEVHGFGGLPRVAEGFFGAGVDVGGDERVQGLCGGGLAAGDLGVKDPLLVGVDLKGGQNINLLQKDQVGLALGRAKYVASSQVI